MQVEAYMSALSTQPFVEFSILLFIDSFVSFFEKKKKKNYFCLGKSQKDTSTCPFKLKIQMLCRLIGLDWISKLIISTLLENKLTACWVHQRPEIS